MISCVILAAGLSERFGSPKAMARIQSETCIELIQRNLLNTPCQEIIVVLGAYADKIQPYVFNHKRIRVVYNKNYKFGQISSAQTAVACLDPASLGSMFLPVDCPFLLPSTIETLINYFLQNQPNILVPTYCQKKGHPPIFHQKLNNEILSVPLNRGLNSLFAAKTIQTLEINDPGITQTFNTPADLFGVETKRL
jgi:molybdenum cofactor cytidylyltransferase